MQCAIQIDGQSKNIDTGLVSVDTIYAVAECDEGRVFLNRDDGIDIPLLLGEHLLIHGGERFVTGERSIEDNPPLRNEIRPEFNGARSVALPKAKTTGKALKELDDKFPQGRLFADITDGVDLDIPDKMVLVVQDADSYFVIPPATDDANDAIDIEECSKHGRRPPKGYEYRVRIDGDKYTVAQQKVTGADILGLVGKRDEEWSLNQKLREGKREKIKVDDWVDLSCPGIERFETVRRQAQQGHD